MYFSDGRRRSVAEKYISDPHLGPSDTVGCTPGTDQGFATIAFSACRRAWPAAFALVASSADSG